MGRGRGGGEEAEGEGEEAEGGGGRGRGEGEGVEGEGEEAEGEGEGAEVGEEEEDAHSDNTFWDSDATWSLGGAEAALERAWRRGRGVLRRVLSGAGLLSRRAVNEVRVLLNHIKWGDAARAAAAGWG